MIGGMESVVSSIPAAWWASADPHVAALARRLAQRHGANVEALCMPYPPVQIDTAGGVAALLDIASARPLWTFYLPLAEQAIQTAEEMALDRVLVPAPEPEDGGIFVDTGSLEPTGAWRKENGLDAPEEA